MIKKRLFDISASIILLLITWPIAFIVSIAIFFNMGLPILFKQRRAGYMGKPFVLLKFRTMLDPEDREGNLLTDAERLTKLGRLMRKTSLDEWPQLWNVLRGDMSLVGPRPLLVQYLDVYTNEHARRHDVMPGITGWAQVNGRQTLMHSQRRDMDVWYVDNWRFILDLKILGMTALQVMRRNGVKLDQKMSTVDDLGFSETLKSSDDLKVE